MTADARLPAAGELPDGWVWTTLGVLAEITGGVTKGRDLSRFETIDVPYLRVANVQSGYLDLSEVKMIKIKAHELEKYRLRPGDVLFTEGGDRDKLGRGTVWGGEIDPCIHQNHVFAARLHIEDISAQWVSLASQVPYARDYFWAVARQTVNLASINMTKLKAFPVPLPPGEEQKRIVARIEALFAQSRRGREALDAVPDLLTSFRQTILAAAFRGQLTQRNPDDEPASVLLERIRAQRRRKWEENLRARGKDPARRKYQEPAPPDTSELPELPRGWIWATIDQLSNVVRGASPRPAGDPRYFGGGIPWITVGCLTANAQTYLHSVPTFVTEAGKDKSRYIERETLLLTNSGATLGVPKITKIRGCINDGIVAILWVDYPLKLYLYYYLTSLTEQLRAIKQGAAQPNLNTSIVKAITIPVAPLAEQHRIIARIEALFAQADALEAAATAAHRRLSAVDQAILARAFRGELVPQDPADEPASVLLERIRKQREGNEK